MEFDQDTAKAVARVRHEMGVGVSEAVNELIRRGLLPREKRGPFKQRTGRLGLKIDVSNITEAGYPPTLGHSASLFRRGRHGGLSRSGSTHQRRGCRRRAGATARSSAGSSVIWTSAPISSATLSSSGTARYSDPYFKESATYFASSSSKAPGVSLVATERKLRQRRKAKSA